MDPTRRIFFKGVGAVATTVLLPATLAASKAAEPIDEGQFVDINGMPQWITIRGQRAGNPVLLWLHGGPGIAMSSQALLFFDWERHFTIVQWDQPGGGSTAAKNVGHAGDLTIDRYVRDAVAVAEWACRRLRCHKLVVMGLSWGSLLGLELAHRRPDLVAAFVGTGQIVDGPAGQILGYELALADARTRQDQIAISELEQAGRPPYSTFESFITRQKYSNPPGQPPSQKEAAAIEATRQLLSAPAPAGAHYVGPTAPAPQMVQEFLDTQRAMFQQTAEWRAEDRVGLEFKMPLLFIQGADDRNTPTQLVREFVQRVKAPRKRLVVIPDLGHSTVVYHEELLRLLLEHVHPLALRYALSRSPTRTR